MAIDTEAKRASATHFLVPSWTQLVFPDGTIDAGDRQASAWCYSGISPAIAGDTHIYCSSTDPDVLDLVVDGVLVGRITEA